MDKESAKETIGNYNEYGLHLNPYTLALLYKIAGYPTPEWLRSDMNLWDSKKLHLQE